MSIFYEEVSFVCPFCGKRCAAVEPPGVLHEAPACDTFIRLDPVEFLHAVNEMKRREN